MRRYNLFLVHLFLSLLTYNNTLGAANVPVMAYAYSFVTGFPIDGALIKIKNHFGETIGRGITNDQGMFGPIILPAGKEIFLTLRRDNYQTTQSATLTIPESGFVGNNKIIFQVPDSFSVWLLRNIIGGEEEKDHCHVAGTLARYGKTYEDLPHGEEGAAISAKDIENNIHYNADFYFDIFSEFMGDLKYKTNPFSWQLQKTTNDGGFLFRNLKPGIYEIEVKKEGICSDLVRFYCRPGKFINLNPPHGPHARPSANML